jgi:hypothetical protein
MDVEGSGVRNFNVPFWHLPVSSEHGPVSAESNRASAGYKFEALSSKQISWTRCSIASIIMVEAIAARIWLGYMGWLQGTRSLEFNW